MAAAPLPVRSPVVVTIEGEIGAGKTTLAALLKEELERRGKSVCLVPEPVEQWQAAGILQSFYGDPRRYAYTFQTFAFATRVLAIAAAAEANPGADFLLLERTPATDRVFMAAQGDAVSAMEREMYNVWCRAYERMLPIRLGDAVVLYLQPSLTCCMERVAGRQRDGEIAADGEAAKHEKAAGSGVTHEYQEKLRRAQEAFFLGRDPGAEFAHLHPSPYDPARIHVIGPDLADPDFRTAAGRVALQNRLCQILGVGTS